jgi:hypothetical protein
VGAASLVVGGELGHERAQPHALCTAQDLSESRRSRDQLKPTPHLVIKAELKKLREDLGIAEKRLLQEA